MLRSRIRDYGLPVSSLAGLDSTTSGPEDLYTVSNEEKPPVEGGSHESDIALKLSLELGEEDEGIRQSYNIAPGYIEPVYRAVMVPKASGNAGESVGSEVKYVVQGMKWGEFSSLCRCSLRPDANIMTPGLVPSWTKRSPDYGSYVRLCLSLDLH